MPSQSLALLARPNVPGIYPGRSDWDGAMRPCLDLVDQTIGQPWAMFPIASTQDVAQAVAAARQCFTQEQSGALQIDRLMLLERLIAQIEGRREDLAQAISREMGAPITFSRVNQIESAISHLQVILDAARDSSNCVEIASGGHYIAYEPMGVAALITPWNWPLNQTALKVGAALVAGCTMVFKPSEIATPSALIFAQCMHDAGAPDGLFNLVLGDGSVGAALCEHPDINIISFTGSTDVGRQIASKAGANLIPAVMELGGKSANILFADCDVDLAVKQGIAHCFRNCGQSCNAASRMLVERSIYDHVLRVAAEEAQSFCFGLPQEEGSHLGPLVSAVQFDKVQDHIQGALAQGARLIAGGPGRAEGFDSGFFPRATVFADVTPDMQIFQREVFGPVLTLTPFDTEQEAISLANATDYGLAGYVQTSTPERAARVSMQMAAGMVQVNGRSRAAGAPFGGIKNSGFGREAGLWGIRTFQHVKSLSGLDTHPAP